MEETERFAKAGVYRGYAESHDVRHAVLMKRLALIATILVVAAGCDKTKRWLGLERPQEPEGPPLSARLNLARRPDIVFQLFGERDDPRMIPVAAIVDGVLKPIELTPSGWREFDAMYTRANRTYPLYRDGAPIGEVRVRRGMWERRDQPLYTLPGCRSTTPLAAVALETTVRLSYTIEALAVTPGVTVQPRAPVELTKAMQSRARSIAHEVALSAGIDTAALTTNGMNLVAINTGATRQPTLLASFLDPEASDRHGITGHVLTIGDDAGAGYAPSFRHTALGPVGAAEFRRYVDHLDVNGDGVDEIMLEGWQFAGETFLSILGYQNGEWREVFRGRSSWCLSRPKMHANAQGNREPGTGNR